ncbi:MAG: DUF5711 family protein [Acutalibacteraceae bacterium]
MVKEKNEKAKKSEKTKKRGTVIIVSLVLIFAVCAAVLYAVPTIMSLKRDNISESGDISSISGEDDALLFSVDSGEIRDITPLSGGGFITTSNSLISIKKDGGIIDITKTGYSSPVTKTAGKYYIVFERSTGKYSIMNKNGTVFSSQLDGEIINADIAENGNYLIMSRKTLSSSLVTVYSRKNEILFQWECNDSYLTNCAIAPRGKKIAVVSFDVNGGEQSSKILTFTTKSVDVEREIDCGSDTVCAMRFHSGDSIGIVTDNRYIIENIQNGERKEISYEYDVISGSAFGENSNAAVLKSEFGSLDKSTLSLYNRNAEEIFTCNINEKVIDFCFDKSFVYVMTACKITVYSVATGEEYSAVETAGGLKYMSVISGRIFCSSDTGVYKYSR